MRRRIQMVILATFVAIIVGDSGYSSDKMKPSQSQADKPKRQTVGMLIEMEEADLAKQDIALVNLTCAVGLPGAEKLDVDRYLATLDKWAGLVRTETDKLRPLFLRDPSNYENSEAYFKLLTMTTVLQLDCGVKYNARAVFDIDFSDPGQQFIHSVIDGQGGTCVSLPILYASVARRLGYPVKLVSAIGHFYCRWDDPETGEKINFEAHGNGMLSFPDKHYQKWPYPMTKRQIESGDFLHSMTPREELASFLSCRGHCLLWTKQFAAAHSPYLHAHRLCPDNEMYMQFLRTYWIARLEPDWEPPRLSGTLEPDKVKHLPGEHPSIPKRKRR